MYVGWIRERFTARLIVLFGSLARGDWLESSDADILVVADELGSDVGENYMVLKECEEVEPIGYNPEFFLQEIRRPNFLILDALRYGKVLYADGDYLERVNRALEEARERFGLFYDGEKWRFSPKRV